VSAGSVTGAWTDHAPEETERAGEALAGALQPGDTIALTGPLGAGKTRFVTGLARGLACPGRVRSPSFSLVNEYGGRITLFHVDLYRIEPMDVDSLGLDEVLERGALVVEWGEKLPSSYRRDALEITIAIGAGTERRFEAHAEARSARAAALLEAWGQAVSAAPRRA
jgi:tRNA threonylcarbamoyladenosine biosynthesis protein TsaE